MLREHRRLVKLVKLRGETQVIEHREYMMAFNVFVGWREQSRRERQFRVKSIMLAKSLGFKA